MANAKGKPHLRRVSGKRSHLLLLGDDFAFTTVPTATVTSPTETWTVKSTNKRGSRDQFLLIVLECTLPKPGAGVPVDAGSLTITLTTPSVPVDNPVDVVYITDAPAPP
jgi:hypothetical protein